jgi:N-methylhydantoinase B
MVHHDLALADMLSPRQDIILLSDPYSCEGAMSHANDWLVVLPIFIEGRMVGWAAMFGHVTDIGGKVACSMPNDAHTIFEVRAWCYVS